MEVGLNVGVNVVGTGAVRWSEKWMEGRQSWGPLVKRLGRRDAKRGHRGARVAVIWHLGARIGRRGAVHFFCFFVFFVVF